MANLETRQPAGDLPRGMQSDREVERTTVEARQGVTGHNVRYVLGFGLVAVIIGMVIVFLIEHGFVSLPS